MAPGVLCELCGGGPKACHGTLGPLLGPLEIASSSGGACFVHRLCILWSPEVYQTEHGTLKNVAAAVRRGRQIKCAHCERRGATVGCRIAKCSCSFHLPCAKAANCTFNREQYVVACPEHAPLFRHEEQHQRHEFTLQAPELPPAELPPSDVLPSPGGGFAPRSLEEDEEAAGSGRGATGRHRAGGLPPGKRRRIDYTAVNSHLELAKQAMAHLVATRGREPGVDEDDAAFAAKEQARMAKERARLQPIILGGSGAAGTGGSGGGGGQAAGGAEQQQQPVLPAALGAARHGFASLGGLDDVVAQLREMVLLPMLHPKLFADMGISPPRGILFHGLPGTGKTHAVRALAAEVARSSPRPVAFFARKGADCLGKYSGDAELALRLLFQMAEAHAPSIIFLDELDALAPARSVRAGTTDQIYASVVATLLALMDGLHDRGQVVVVGATNRPESVDAALRRPGRFDREVFFGLPSAAGRLAVLQVHTRGWQPTPTPELLRRVAQATEGYAGADLQALCSSAVLCAVRRAAPDLSTALDAELEAAAVAAAAAAQAASAQAVMAAAAAAAAGAVQDAQLMSPAAAAAVAGGMTPQAAAAAAAAAAGGLTPWKSPLLPDSSDDESDQDDDDEQNGSDEEMKEEEQQQQQPEDGGDGEGTTREQQQDAAGRLGQAAGARPPANERMEVEEQDAGAGTSERGQGGVNEERRTSGRPAAARSLLGRINGGSFLATLQDELAGLGRRHAPGQDAAAAAANAVAGPSGRVTFALPPTTVQPALAAQTPAVGARQQPGYASGGRSAEEEDMEQSEEEDDDESMSDGAPAQQGNQEADTLQEAAAERSRLADAMCDGDENEDGEPTRRATNGEEGAGVAGAGAAPPQQEDAVGGGAAAGGAAALAAAAAPPPPPPPKWLEEVEVKEGDWWAALAAAPPPSSQREASSAFTAVATATARVAGGSGSGGGGGRCLPSYTVTLLQPHLTTPLQLLHTSGLPLPTSLGTACTAAADADATSDAQLHSTLLQLLCGEEGGQGSDETSGAALLASQGGRQTAGGTFGASYRQLCLMLHGAEADAAAAALLRLADGAQVHTINLPSMLIAGAGEPDVGCADVVKGAVSRAAAHVPLVLYLPHLNDWAVERLVCVADDDKEEEQRPGDAGATGEAKRGPMLGASAPQQPTATRLQQHGLTAGTSTRSHSISSQGGGPGAGSPRLAVSVHTAPEDGSMALTLMHGASPSGRRHQHHGGRHLVSSRLSSDAGAASATAASTSAAASGLWMLFEQLLQQVPSQVPVVVLATLRGPLAALPEAVAARFAALAAPQLPAQDAAVKAAIGQAGSHVERAVREVATEALSAAVAPAPKQQQQQQQQQRQRSSTAAAPATMQRAAPGSTTAAAAPAVPAAFQGLSPSEVDTAKRLATQVQSGIRSVAAAMLSDPRCLAARARLLLGKDKRSKRSRQRRSSGEAVAEATLPLAKAERVSLSRVAKRAWIGEFASIDAFRDAVRVTAAKIRELRSEAAAVAAQRSAARLRQAAAARRSAAPGSSAAATAAATGAEVAAIKAAAVQRYHAASAAASLWEDHVDAWAHQLAQQLQLYDPTNARLLRAGTAAALQQAQPPAAPPAADASAAGGVPSAAPGPDAAGVYFVHRRDSTSASRDDGQQAEDEGDAGSDSVEVLNAQVAVAAQRVASAARQLLPKLLAEELARLAGSDASQQQQQQQQQQQAVVGSAALQSCVRRALAAVSSALHSAAAAPASESGRDMAGSDGPARRRQQRLQQMAEAAARSLG